MKKTLEEKVRSELLRFGRKNRCTRVLAVPALCITMFFFHIISFIKGNGKRLAMMAMSLFLFAVYSSFSFPAFITKVSEEEHNLPISGEQSISLAQEAEVDMEELQLLSDEDVLEASDYSNTSHGYTVIDKYEASEILDSSANRDKAEDAFAAEEQQESFSADDWKLVLINKQNSIPQDYTFRLGTIKGSMQCDERILDELLDMLQAAREDGVDLMICSPYRDLEYQEKLFNRKIDRYMSRGMSYMEAYQLSSQAVTVPGASEHQIGLALDIVCGDYMSLDAGFGDTQAGKWLAANSCTYGFILRYPLGKEDITGIEYEPWHFRYVGKAAATVITERGITLEEFWEEYIENVPLD